MLAQSRKSSRDGPMRRALWILIVSLATTAWMLPADGQSRAPRKKDAKSVASNKLKPPQDPELANYGIYEKTAPTPSKTDPVATTLPLSLKKEARIAFVGNTLLDRGQDYAYFESMLVQAHPEHDLVIRNFAWSADEVDLQPRPDNFATVAQHLTREKIDVIFAAFGYNESFAGIDHLASFKERLSTWITETKCSAFNGETGPQIVLLSPIANENTAAVKAADMNNDRLAAYTQAMLEVATEHQVGFANLFEASRQAMAPANTDITINGAHLNAPGYAKVDAVLFRESCAERGTATGRLARAEAYVSAAFCAAEAFIAVRPRFIWLR